MNKKFQIFISSTYEDLKEERSKVVATILKSNHFPLGWKCLVQIMLNNGSRLKGR